VDLIQTIQEELLKSAELTGLWERNSGRWSAENTKPKLSGGTEGMVRQIVFNVKSDNRRMNSLQVEKR